jgi:hypothetical protein
LQLADFASIATILGRNLKALVPFEVQFKPLIDTMKQKKEEVDKLARVAHEVFGMSTFIALSEFY